MTPPGDQRVRSLRLDRRALREERARVGWWRRLVRARIDLLVATAARPQPLGEDVAFQLPLDVSLGAPRPAELAGLIDGLVDQGAGAGLTRIDDLRELDERLADYERGVTDALARTTDSLITRLADDPGPAGGWLTEPLGRG
ncbi:hypothetical protein KIN34_06545 [Cellulomonas sp. DKR-3]|uniref:Uncharacterized protein n=1 Tax=Cellulomonas fulva TaxID=2835530 RepID=A0ABS5TXX5_9CELL|nr:hypothetical protein [Cellulomonas fulva]MBT0993942.1 hypothetical protein [Cellulomonas fulva]